jgi:predicted nucleic acid-binding protein
MRQLRRILFDTNVYTTILDAKKTERFVNPALRGKTVFYGFSVIRQELRAIPKNIMLSHQNYRSVSLEYYDLLVRNHHLDLTATIESLARSYQKEYSGGISTRKLWHDFLIVACAAINNLNIVVTEDRHSLSSPLAKRAYHQVNSRNGYQTPQFYSLQDFEETLPV